MEYAFLIVGVAFIVLAAYAAIRVRINKGNSGSRKGGYNQPKEDPKTPVDRK